MYNIYVANVLADVDKIRKERRIQESNTKRIEKLPKIIQLDQEKAYRHITTETQSSHLAYTVKYLTRDGILVYCQTVSRYNLCNKDSEDNHTITDIERFVEQFKVPEGEWKKNWIIQLILGTLMWAAIFAAAGTCIYVSVAFHNAISIIIFSIIGLFVLFLIGLGMIQSGKSLLKQKDD